MAHEPRPSAIEMLRRIHNNLYRAAGHDHDDERADIVDTQP